MMDNIFISKEEAKKHSISVPEKANVIIDLSKIDTITLKDGNNNPITFKLVVDTKDLTDYYEKLSRLFLDLSTRNEDTYLEIAKTFNEMAKKELEK